MTHGAQRALASLALALLIAACGGGQTGPPESEAEPELPPDRFSSRRVLGELEMLLAFRADGADEESRAASRRRIRGVLEESRIAVDTVRTLGPESEGEAPAYEHLVATLPGDASDRFVLAAPLGTPAGEPAEAAEELSGAALLVELARVFARRDFPYTLQFVWVDPGRGFEEGAEAPALSPGARSLARAWAEEGRLDDVRLLVAVNRVCGTPLEIARDLSSHRNYRDQIFRTARALGRGSAFPTDRPFASVTSTHVAFRRAGLRGVVAIEGMRRDTAEGEAQGAAADFESGLCNPSSVDSVGLVLVEGLERIGERLAKIDRFAHVPRVESTEPEEEPEPDAGPGDESGDVEGSSDGAGAVP